MASPHPSAIGEPKGRLKDGPAVLSWVLARLQYRLRSGVGINVRDKTGTERVTAGLTLTRAAAAHGYAVLAAARARVPEASMTNVRAMLELWADQRLVHADATGGAARKLYVAGALALARKDESRRSEERLRERFPDEYGAVSRLRPYSHWTGGGRKKAVEDACGAEYANLYEFLSWDSHPIVQLALDVHARSDAAGKYRIMHRIPPRDLARDMSVTAAHVIRDMWNSLAPEVWRAPS